MVRILVFLGFFYSAMIAASGSEILDSFGLDGSGLSSELNDENSNADLAKVTEILTHFKKLDLSLKDSARDVYIKFSGECSPAMLGFSLDFILNSIGYPNYRQMAFSNSPYQIINLKINHTPNPATIYKAFKNSGIYIKNFSKTGENSYAYELDFTNADLKIKTDNGSLLASTKPYFLNILGKNSINIISSQKNKWHPNIVVFDKFLNIIESGDRDNVVYELEYKFPKNSHYVMIWDLYAAENLKDGLKVTFN